MKGKYFKLKILAILSTCLIIVGITGSYKMVSAIQDGIDKQVIKKTTYSIKEILKTEKEIKFIDLSNYEGYNVEIKKSEDDFNHITATYKDKYFENVAEFDEKSEGKINVRTNKIKFEEKSRFNLVGKMIDNATIYNKLSYLFINSSEKIDKTKLVLEVKNPVEIMGIVNEKSDRELIKNEFTFDVYNKYSFSQSEFENILDQFKEFTIKNVNQEKIVIPNTDLKTLNYSTDSIEKLLISGNETIYKEKNLTNINISAEKVKDFVEVDLKSLTTDLNIKGAKKVVLAGLPKNVEILVKYKINDEEKHFIVAKKLSGKNETTIRKVINIESEKIFRTSMDSDFIQGNLEKVTDLKEVK